MPTLEVFADVGCPFAHVGLRLARQRRDDLGLAGEWMWVRAWPLELVNGKPQDPETVLVHIADLHLRGETLHARVSDPVCRFTAWRATGGTDHTRSAGSRTAGRRSARNAGL